MVQALRDSMKEASGMAGTETGSEAVMKVRVSETKVVDGVRSAVTA
jgi:hypothetical protein